MRMPWAGGTDSPQFSAVDLNGDGINDLFVFDRVGDRIETFISNGDGSDTMYTYAPQYETVFPAGLQHWVILADYNHDGIPDLFTYCQGPDYPGIRVYKGSRQNGVLHYDLVKPYLQYPDTPYYPGLFTNLLDIPSIADVNGDGYLDVLVYNQYGSTISYYENQTGIGGGTGHYDIDSFALQQITTCWGNILQSRTTNQITLDVSCKGGTGYIGPDTGIPKDLRHSGNSLYPFTDPVYRDVDLLNGNLSYNSLFLLRNCGNTTLANVCEYDSIFLECDVPIIMPSYPAAFGLNISNDSVSDLLVSPNIEGPYTVGAGSARNVLNVQYYKGTGDTSCWYSYQGDSFLVHHMLDFGTMSRPLFYDLDGDGLLDMVVSGYGYYQYNANNLSPVAFYKNTGTATQPRFTLQTLDYDSLSQLQIFDFNVSFGDMDGDGKNDMVAGDINGDIYFLKNTSTTGGSTFPALTANWSNTMGIGVNLFSSPIVYDLNGDSLPDLIVGTQAGTLTYFWNYGTRQNPVFSSDSSNTYLGNISVAVGSSTLGYSQPFIRIDSAGNQLLFVGSMSGQVHEYLINPANLKAGSFIQIDSDFMHTFTGQTSNISIADINNDGKLEYLLGTAAGGVLLYSDSLWDTSTLPLAVSKVAPPENGMRIYPNPAKDYFSCITENGFVDPQVQVFDITGQLAPAEVTFNNGQLNVKTAVMGSGFYIVCVYDEGRSYRGKVIVAK